ncbi:MAG: RNA methyltransferase [Planctomycetota bacterium]|nr:RNA methyltransferase [Planctomycetota bacterium]
MNSIPERPVIRSKSNARLKDLRRLFRRKTRKKTGQTVLLGSKIIADALADGLEFREIFLKEGATLTFETTVPIHIVESPIYNTLCPLESPPDVLAVVTVPTRDFTDLAPKKTQSSAFVVACGVQDPGNLGTIMRTAWFFGLRGLATTIGTTDPWSPKVLRASIGALLRSPPAFLGSFEEALHACFEQGYTPVFLVASGGESLGTVRLPEKCAFFLGEEGQGFVPEQLALIAKFPNDILEVTIEGSGEAESLNVAIAFSLGAYAWSQQHLKASLPKG